MTRDYVAFAAEHALMVWQREERRDTGRPLRRGDRVQAVVGGEIRTVVQAESAGDYLDRRSRAVVWPRKDGRCATPCALFARTRGTMT